MFNKILVAVDHSDASASVFERALELAIASQASLMLVHVLTDEESGLALPYPTGADAYSMGLTAAAWQAYASRWQAREKEGLEQLRAFQQQAQEAGLEAEFSQNFGSPGRRICDVACMWNADLIVVGSRRRSGLSELLLGSVSNYVIHHAPCSVMMMSPGKGRETAVVEVKVGELAANKG